MSLRSHLLIPAADSLPALQAELLRHNPRLTLEQPAPDLLGLRPDDPASPLPRLAFARQFLPSAVPVEGTSIRTFADHLFEALITTLPEGQPWRLHIEPHFGSPEAGRNRCHLIEESLVDRLKRQRRHLLRRRRNGHEPLAADESLVQFLLLEPGRAFLSFATPPIPLDQLRLLSPFPKGEVPVASDKAAPCRAFAKLVEAELRLGRPIAPAESCVDLGASPGSWSYVALHRGASVVAVDRSPLRDDLMRHPRLTFHRGDAFAFAPAQAVDWLLCDVIAAPVRSIDLVLTWCRQRLCRHFVVTIKFKGGEEYPVLDRLRDELPEFSDDFLLTRLCANKNEVCVAGSVRNPGGPRLPR